MNSDYLFVAGLFFVILAGVLAAVSIVVGCFTLGIVPGFFMLFCVLGLVCLILGKFLDNIRN